jgi:hypothetical protein
MALDFSADAAAFWCGLLMPPYRDHKSSVHVPFLTDREATGQTRKPGAVVLRRRAIRARSDGYLDLMSSPGSAAAGRRASNARGLGTRSHSRRRYFRVEGIRPISARRTERPSGSRRRQSVLGNFISRRKVRSHRVILSQQSLCAGAFHSWTCRLRATCSIIRSRHGRTANGNRGRHWACHQRLSNQASAA